jgi:hypothetical protein
METLLYSFILGFFVGGVLALICFVSWVCKLISEIKYLRSTVDDHESKISKLNQQKSLLITRVIAQNIEKEQNWIELEHLRAQKRKAWDIPNSV